VPTKHGKKWRIRPFDERGKRVSMVFDDYRTALREERKFETKVDEIKRGLRTRDPPDKTFNDLADYWLEKRAMRKRSRKDDESIIRKHLRPAFGSMKLRDIGVEDVDDFIVDREHLSEKTIANQVTLLSTMLRLANTFKVPWLLRVPKFNKPKVRLFSRDYRWLRSEDEIRRLLGAAREHAEQTFVLYTMAIYTGMREGELAAVEWPDIDFERRLITVQRSFDGPTKSDRVRYVPILDPLLPVLKSWRLRGPGRLVFVNRDGGMYRECARVFREVLHRVLEEGDFGHIVIRGKKRPYIRFHDLRHTFASHWVMRGGDIFKLQKILGHQSVQMTMRYAHLAPEAFAADWGRMGAEVPAGEAEVVDLSNRQERKRVKQG
jgi:integrase